MAARIQIRRDFANNWILNNPILTEGELGYELDTGKLKVGDGVRVWNSLNYFQETVKYTDVIDPPTSISYFDNDVGYLTPSTPAGLVTNLLINNWNDAYSWGDHADAGYLTTSNAASTFLTIANASTSYQPIDDDLTSIAGLTGTTGLLRKTAANTWSLDTNTYLTTASAASNYLTQSSAASTYQPIDDDLTSIAELTGTAGLLRKTAANTWSLDTNNYLTTADAAGNVSSQDIDNWNAAYGWGDHAGAGYLTSASAASTYLTTSSAASAYLTQSSAASTYLTQANASSTYLTTSSAASTYLTQTDATNNYQPIDDDLTVIAGLTGNAGLLRKTAANTWSLDTNTYLTTYTETDPTVPVEVKAITATDINNWNDAFGWGDHGLEGYARIVAAPATPTSTGTAGTIAYDATYFYTCIATDIWKRIEWDATWV